MRELIAMQLLDSALPTGSFSHSLGFETYLNRGTIHDADSFGAWLEMFLGQLAFTDALAIRLTYRAENLEELLDLDELMAAQALATQVRNAGIAMGRRLAKIAQISAEVSWLSDYANTGYGNPAIVWGLVARHIGLEEDDAVVRHLYSTATTLTQNAVRAIPIGQDSGQKVLARAREWSMRAAEVSSSLGKGALGAIAPGLEIAQMQHETQRARLFMS